MSKKNSSVILKKSFKNSKSFTEIYLNFKKKLDKLNSKKYAVAVSGGPDSLALSALTKAYSYEKKVKINYLLVNHNIRRNSANEALKVKKLLKKYNINLNVLNNKKNIAKNIQGEARNIRYELMANYCFKKRIKIILTGHNLEDQVETFFIRLSRGSGLTGLSAMRPITKIYNNLNLFRPLLDIKKETLIKIAKKVFGKYFKDPSNKNKKYLRTKIRSLKKPLLKSGIKYEQIIKSINNLSSSKITLENYFKDLSKKIITRSKDTISIDYKKFNNLNTEFKIKTINFSIKELKKNYYNLRSKKVINLIKKLSTNNFSKATLGGCMFFIKKDKICLKIEKI